MASNSHVSTMNQTINGDSGNIPARVNQGHTEQILLENPLRLRSVKQTKDDARFFHQNHRLEDIVDEETFVRAALAARDNYPAAYDDIEGLTFIEKKALREEQTMNFWQQIKRLSRQYRLNLATCILSAIAQGWDQSSINGANLGWPGDFGLRFNLANPRSNTHDVWLFGLVNASPFLSASLVGCWISDPLNEYIGGRRGALLIAGLFSFSTVIGAAYTRGWKSLLACRVLLGVGMGAKASVVPIFLSETAPKNLRGTLVASWQLMDAFGIFLGFTANLVVYPNWRRMVAAAFIPALLFLILVPFCVESPRWLLKKGRYQKALKAWIVLHGDPTPLLACRNMYAAHVQLQNETKYFSGSYRDRPIELQAESGGAAHDTYQQEVKLTSYWIRLQQLYKTPRIRRAATASFCVMVAQQACGVNILAFLSSTVFEDALNIGKDDTNLNGGPLTPDERVAQKNALWFSFGFGLFNFLFTFITFGIIDRKGKRFLLNWSFPNMSWTLLASGLCFQISRDMLSLRLALFIFFVILFTLAYSAGEGPIAFIVSSEVWPSVNREVGMSFAVFWNLLGSGILALIVPVLAYALGHTGLLALFAGFTLIAWAACFFLVPETARISLEELNQIFEISTMKQVRYRIEVLQWAFRRYLFRKTVDEPEPLYIWAEEMQNRQDDNRQPQPTDMPAVNPPLQTSPTAASRV